MKKNIVFIVAIVFLSCQEEHPQENVPPLCNITQPSGNEIINKGDIVPIIVEADDEDGYIKEVRLYINDEGIISLKDFPYKYNWITSNFLPGLYKIVAVAEDDNGRESSDSINLTIDYDLPIVETQVSKNITDSSAILVGEVLSDGWGSISEMGFYYGDSEDLINSGSKQDVTSDSSTYQLSLSGLEEVSVYYYSAYAINERGESMGEILTFTTEKTVLIPSVEIENTTEKIGINRIMLNFYINSDGGGEITETGVYYDTQPDPITNGKKALVTPDGIGRYTLNIDGLNENTRYYFSAYAINSAGPAYSEEAIFTTYPSTVVDVDGNVYRTVAIDGLLWMGENLKVTHLSDGSLIPEINDSLEWIGYQDYGYCSYLNSDSLENIYGLLYNWQVVSNEVGVCPDGWHVSTENEWWNLITLAGENMTTAGGPLKEVGTDHWIEPNRHATDEFGFTALPGGIRFHDGGFYNIGESAYFIAAPIHEENYTIFEITNAGSLSNYDNNPMNLNMGVSIRCVKD